MKPVLSFAFKFGPSPVDKSQTLAHEARVRLSLETTLFAFFAGIVLCVAHHKFRQRDEDRQCGPGGLLVVPPCACQWGDCALAHWHASDVVWFGPNFSAPARVRSSKDGPPAVTRACCLRAASHLTVAPGHCMHSHQRGRQSARQARGGIPLVAISVRAGLHARATDFHFENGSTGIRFFISTSPRGLKGSAHSISVITAHGSGMPAANEASPN
jgi:hypothetical protein